ncbi:MAG TPA: chemotaxis response regulator protein-glutamate methylesterase [Clostridia bacterium]|nr:chemotaxis response regulator protein-glutamate methylesterase [Clostridia bacterium]
MGPLPVKVLVVDDSAYMRRVITAMLENDQSIQVVGFARDGKDALEKIQRLKPDVITLDVEMPGMDGLETLQEIMGSNPLPVVMVSGLTAEGAQTTLKALELGAVDFVAKPEKRQDLMLLAEELPAKVKMAAGVPAAKIHPLGGVSPVRFPPLPVTRVSPRGFQVVIIGTSTGGPAALAEIFKNLPGDLEAAVLMVQHMPPGFTRTLAQRLNDIGNLPVKEAEEGDPVFPGRALLAPAGWQMELDRVAGEIRVHLSTRSSFPTPFKPSVDVLCLSAARLYGKSILAVILTGMGNDGVRGLQAIKKASGFVLAQDEASCIVYGMPKAAVEAGVVDKIIPLTKIGEEISSLIG